MAAAKKRGVELLTMFPRTPRAGFWQQVGVPYLGSLLLIFFDPFRVNNPKTKTGFVNGQFLLITAPTYRALGGHECGRDYVIEDVPFGQHAKRQGVRCFVGSGEHLAEVRMYRDFRAMTTGFARILWGAFKRRWRMAAAMLILLVAAAPFVAGPLLLAHWACGGTTLNSLEQTVLGSLCALQLLNANCFNYHVWRACGLSGIWLFTYPLAIPVAMLTVLKATTLAGRGMNWRDVKYRVDASGKIVS